MVSLGKEVTILCYKVTFPWIISYFGLAHTCQRHKSPLVTVSATPSPMSSLCDDPCGMRTTTAALFPGSSVYLNKSLLPNVSVTPRTTRDSYSPFGLESLYVNSELPFHSQTGNQMDFQPWGVWEPSFLTRPRTSLAPQKATSQHLQK